VAVRRAIVQASELPSVYELGIIYCTVPGLTDLGCIQKLRNNLFYTHKKEKIINYTNIHGQRRAVTLYVIDMSALQGGRPPKHKIKILL